MVEKKFIPGDIIYADSNFSHANDCFGVVVDKDFWLEQAKIENVLEESLKEYNEKHHIPFRVLGKRLFRQSWRANNPEEFEPDENKLMHYRFNLPVYTQKINLKSLIQARNIPVERFEGDLFSFEENISKFLDLKNHYFEEVLSQARIVYEYLEGKRFDKSKEHIFKEDKFLRLLQKAIPLENC